MNSDTCDKNAFQEAVEQLKPNLSPIEEEA